MQTLSECHPHHDNKYSIFNSGPMHPVLTIPELLYPVFRFLDHHSNATNACVCKAWSSIAVSVLWNDVDLWRLVSLLDPLKNGRDSLYVRLLFICSPLC